MDNKQEKKWNVFSGASGKQGEWDVLRGRSKKTQNGSSPTWSIYHGAHQPTETSSERKWSHISGFASREEAEKERDPLEQIAYVVGGLAGGVVLGSAFLALLGGKILKELAVKGVLWDSDFAWGVNQGLALAGFSIGGGKK